MDHVSQTRLAKYCGSRDDSLSWNLSRAKQGDTIRVDGMSPRDRGQGSASECSKHKAKPRNENAAGCATKENHVSTTRLPGNDESLMISEEE